MKRIFIACAALLFSWSAHAQTTEPFGVYVGGLPSAGSVSGADSLYVLQGGVSKKVSPSVIGGAPGGVNPQIQFNNAGSFGGLTDVQVTSRIQAFTNTLSGAAPASGGGTTNFLRADGTWAAPPGGGGGTPGAPTSSIQWNSAGSFAGFGNYNGTNFLKLAVDAASPGTQTIAGQSTSTGTANIAGGDFILQGGLGTGTGVGGSVLLFTAPSGTAGSTQNVASERVRVDRRGHVIVGGFPSTFVDTFNDEAILQSVVTSGSLIVNNSWIRYSNDTSPALVMFSKTRGAGPATQVAVAANDSIGQMCDAGSDGTNYIASCFLTVAVDGTVGTNSVPTRIVFSTAASGTGAYGDLERLRINSLGNVSINGAPILGQLLSGAVNGEFQVLGTSGEAAAAIIRYSATATSGRLHFAKSRGAAVGTNTIVSSGDAVGQLSFEGANGTTFDQAAVISGEIDGTPGASANMPGRLIFLTTPAGSSTPVERLRIASNAFMTWTAPTSGSNIVFEDFGNAGLGWFSFNTGGGSFMSLNTARGTSGSPLAVAVNDELAAWQGRGARNSVPAYATAGLIQVLVDSGTVSATSMPGRIVLSTTANGTVSPVEGLRLDSARTLTLTNGATNTLVLTQGDATYNNIIFNGAFTNFGAMLGIEGGGGTDKNLYFNFPSGGAHVFSSAGTTISQMDGTGWAILSSRSLHWPIASPDTFLFRDAAVGTLALADSTTAVALRVYNTTDQNSTGAAPTNYERGVFDWTTTANVLTIGTQKGGTGSGRDVSIVSSTGITLTAVTNSATLSSSPDVAFLQTVGNLGVIVGRTGINTGGSAFIGSHNAVGGAQSGAVTVVSNGVIGFSASGVSTTAGDAYIFRVATAVVGFSQTPTTNPPGTDGWLQWGGQKRVTSDVTFTSTTTLATVTGLSVTVAAGRTYTFEAELSWTDAAAGGIQAAIAGTATATNIIYDGWITDSAANGIKGNTQATALGTAVASSTTTGTAGHLTIKGTITVNAAGTLLVQAAQNTSNGTATTVKRGSYFIVHDMP